VCQTTELPYKGIKIPEYWETSFDYSYPKIKGIAKMIA
jgi:hypothetical protein